MNKPDQSNQPIHDILRERWSPRRFTAELPPQAVLERLFEAARWAPSSMNAQPWFFILARKEDPPAYAKMFSLLSERNQAWADSAPLLVLAVMNSLRDNGKPHRWAPYDLGQAVAHLTFQAGAEGLSVHQMGGFDAAKAIEIFHLPAGYEAMTVLAIGKVGEPEPQSRIRKPLNEVVFAGEWGKETEF